MRTEKGAEGRFWRKESKLALCLGEEMLLKSTLGPALDYMREADVGRASFESFCFPIEKACCSQVLQTLPGKERQVHTSCVPECKFLKEPVHGSITKTWNTALYPKRCSKNIFKVTEWKYWPHILMYRKP